MKVHLLSRLAKFTALHGVSNDHKDYLSIPKNQGTEGLCWAYSLTSAIETKFALESGNRLMLDPMPIYDRSASYWKKHCKDESCKDCKAYRNDKGYAPQCATGYMVKSGDTMKQKDGNNSYLSVVEQSLVKIDTVQGLFDQLDKHKLLLSTFSSSSFIYNGYIVPDYRIGYESDHSVVITSVGTLEDYEGLFVEVLNSWGYDLHHDGLLYVKVADNENDILHNNMALFDENIWIEVKRKDDKKKMYKILMWIFVALTGVSLIVIAVVIIKQRTVNEATPGV